MARTIDSGLSATLGDSQTEIFHLFEFIFSTSTIRYCTAPHDSVWDSKTWIGIGGALAYEAIEETNDMIAGAVTLTLSGVNQSMIAVFLTENFIGREATIYRGHINTTTGAQEGEPLEEYNGFLNSGFQVHETRAENGKGTVRVKTRLVGATALFKVRRGIITNLGSHQAVFSGDKFFEFMPDLQDKPITWGIV